MRVSFTFRKTESERGAALLMWPVRGTNSRCIFTAGVCFTKRLHKLRRRDAAHYPHAPTFFTLTSCVRDRVRIEIDLHACVGTVRLTGEDRHGVATAFSRRGPSSLSPSHAKLRKDDHADTRVRRGRVAHGELRRGARQATRTAVSTRCVDAAEQRAPRRGVARRTSRVGRWTRRRAGARTSCRSGTCA